MKKQLLPAILFMMAGLAVLGFIAPWWVLPFWIVLVAAMMTLHDRESLLAGGISYIIICFGMALYMIQQDDADIIMKTGTLLGGLSTTLMLLGVILISMITGSLSGWLGSAIGNVYNTSGSRKEQEF